MKKTVAFIIASALVFSTAAMAVGNMAKGVLDKNTLTFTNENAEVGTLMLFEEGRLFGVKTADADNGSFAFEVSDGDMAKDMRIHFYGDGTYPVEVATPVPEPTPTPEPEKTPYPAAYEKPLDAINAPAVVSDVAQVAVDGELLYELKVWYQGRELVTNVREKVTVASAPEEQSHLVGERVDCLMAGDVVHLTADMQGRVKSIEFIYRPAFAAYFENGISTDGMLGTDNFSTYYFGTAVETYKDAIELADADGNICDLDVSPDAFVYAVTKTRRGADVTLDGTGPRIVETAYIPDGNIDGGAVDWNGIDGIPYILVRESRGVVTDIITFR